MGMAKINDQQEFFAAAKKSARLIVIFTRNAPSLTDRLNIYMLPTIVCIMDNKVHKQHNGLNEIDGSGKYSSCTLEYLLHVDDMLDEAPLYDEEIREEEEELADLDD